MGILRSPGFLIGLAAILLCMIGGFVAILWIRRWLKGDAQSSTETRQRTLEHYQTLLNNGEITEEEYHKIVRTLDS